VFHHVRWAHDEVSVGHNLRYVGSLDRRHATSFDPIEEEEEESGPREAPFHSVGCLGLTGSRAEALGRDARDRPPWSCGHHRSSGSAELAEDALGGFDHRRERPARFGGETGGCCHIGQPTTNVAIWGGEQCEASICGNPVHPPSVGRVPRESHLADAGADLQAGLAIDLSADELAQTLMRRRRLSRVALGRAIGDRRRAREPPVPQRHKSRTRVSDHPIRTLVARWGDRRRGHEANDEHEPSGPPRFKASPNHLAHHGGDPRAPCAGHALG